MKANKWLNISVWWLTACTFAHGDPTELTAVELQTGIAQGRLTATEIATAYLERIETVDGLTNAIIETNPTALEIARSLDAAFTGGGPVGPLHGLPVVLKANIDTGDALVTSAGSLALADHRANEDAHLVTRLRAAGAVILAKANLSEWANFRGSRSVSGWSSVGGQTHNAYVLDRNPCGSSSGSAVAVAASLTPLAVGTETNGSIVCPAGINGVVGVKPTLGLVSRHGIIPIAESQDTAGPMARTVGDARLLLEAMAGSDPRDPSTLDVPALGDGLEGPALAGIRIGVVRDYFGAGRRPTTEAAYGDVARTLAGLGAELVDPIEIGFGEGFSAAERQLLIHEFKDGLNRYLAAHRTGFLNLAELIEFNDANKDRVMPVFGQEIFVAAQATDSLQSDTYRDAFAGSVMAARRLVAAALDDNDLELLIAPVNAPAWKTDWVAGDSGAFGSSSIAAVSGFPSVAVPAALIKGLPVGVAFIGRPFSERLLLDVAERFETERGPFPRAGLVPTLER